MEKDDLFKKQVEEIVNRFAEQARPHSLELTPTNRMANRIAVTREKKRLSELLIQHLNNQ